MKKLCRNQKIHAKNSNRIFIVDSLIHAGSGQGDIYKVHAGKDVYAMKLFHNGNEQKIRRQLENLTRRGRASSAFVHPMYMVNVDGAIGYIMEYIGGAQYDDGYILFNGKEKKDANGDIVREEIPFNEKIAALYHIAEAVNILYEADIALMDLKFDNVKINRRDRSVKILDTDTAVGGRTGAIVSGTVGFMPPLTMRGEEIPNRYNDSYALAVMIFMSLIGGHPLRGRAYEEPINGSPENYIFATNPVYIFNKKDQTNRPPENEKRIIARMKKYPAYFAEAMHRTFTDGIFEREKRVTPREWMEILVRLYDDHFICQHCGEEHFVGSSDKTCDVCGKPLYPPIKIICDGKSDKGIYLFNNSDIKSSELWEDSNERTIFKVVVSDFDKRYGLLLLSSQELRLELKNGQSRIFNMGETIPIFLDAVMEIDKHKINFMGGHKK